MKMTKMVAIAAVFFFGAATANAQDAAKAQDEANAQSCNIIKVDANMVPVNYVNKSLDELKEGVGELETILETENFQLYQAGDYSFKVENDVVVSQSIQFEDANDDKVLYKKVLEALQKTKFIKDTHNTGGNNYQYADFQIQFDDFQGYQKLTYSVIPTDYDLTEK